MAKRGSADELDEGAPHMERTAARARALLGSVGGRERTGIAAAESSHARVGPPDDDDARAIAKLLRRVARPALERAAPPTTGRHTQDEAEALAAALVDRARTTMSKLESGASGGSIGDDEALALESVIRVRGRPALAIQDGRIEGLDAEKHPGSGFWRTQLDDHETQLLEVADVTGAVMVKDTITGRPPWVEGTAWLVRADLAVTNRHVLFPHGTGVRIGARTTPGATDGHIKPDYEVVVDFAHDDGPSRQKRFQVVGIPFVSAENDPVDVAVLRLAGSGASMAPLQLAAQESGSKWLYLLGHPGPVANVPEQVFAVFGTPNGRKRVALGQRMTVDETSSGELIHDASTIGGFSGSAVMMFGAPGVAALHYYGDPADGNRAIRWSKLRAHAAGAFLL